jgi:hypothetical protein
LQVSLGTLGRRLYLTNADWYYYALFHPKGEFHVKSAT